MTEGPGSVAATESVTEGKLGDVTAEEKVGKVAAEEKDDEVIVPKGKRCLPI